jgi:hypothetical protein
MHKAELLAWIFVFLTLRMLGVVQNDYTTIEFKEGLDLFGIIILM